MFKFKKSLIALLVVLVGIVTLYAQGRGTPSNLRVRIDANGALVTASAAQVNPVTSVQFSNARLATDASGNLLTVISGGSGVGTVTSVATTSPITGGTITSTGTIACATCLVSTTPVTIGQGGTGITSLTPASYTPTLTNIVVGDGTSLGSQLTVGKLVHWYFSFTFGSTSTITNPATFTVPTAAANSGQASTNADRKSVV